MSIRDYKITDAQFSEKGVIAAPDTLTGTAAENKGVFDRFAREIIAPQFNAIVDKFTDMEESANNWSDKEAQRVQQENARQSAEQGRVSAEGQRVQSEKTRLSAESRRVADENARSAAETARVNAENKRDSAEKSRAAAESGRVSAESARVTAESQRTNAESVRAQNESARISAETGRADAEADRVSAEDTRISAETARKTAETNRASAETVRESGEAARKSAETGRVSAEMARANAESTRQTSETARVSAEKSRAAAETARQSAETARNVWEAYDAAKTYVPDNKVSFNGSSYVCTAATTGHAPTDTAYWLLIAQKGADGRGAGDMLASVYDPKGRARDAFSFASSEAADAVSAHNTSASAHSALFAKKQDKLTAGTDYATPAQLTVLKTKAHKVSLTVAGWDSSTKQQTVSVADVVADETAQLILPMPAAASMTAYNDAGIQCTAQAAGKLTFTADTVPTVAIDMYVTITPVSFS